MALEGPQVRYARADDVSAEDSLPRALKLARQIEELLEDMRSMSVAALRPAEAEQAHSTRIARAMAASLVDELEALVRGRRKTTASGPGSS